MKLFVPLDLTSVLACLDVGTHGRALVIDALYDDLDEQTRALVEESDIIEIADTDVGRDARRRRASGLAPKGNEVAVAVAQFLSSEEGFKHLLNEGCEITLVHQDGADVSVGNHRPSTSLRIMAASEMERSRSDAVAIKANGRIARKWGLSDERIAALLALSVDRWLTIKPGELSEEQRLRASAVVGIYRILGDYFAEGLALSWITLPNQGPLFQGGAAGRPDDRARTSGHPRSQALPRGCER